MAQYARPDGIYTGSDYWTGTEADIDEETPNDADSIQSVNHTNSEEIYTLSDVTDPSSSTGHTMRFRCQKGGADVQNRGLNVHLYCGATLVHTYTITDCPDSWTTYEYTLSSEEADAISSYTDLRVGFESTGWVGSPAKDRSWVAVSWMELEVPDAAGGPEQGDLTIARYHAVGHDGRASTYGSSALVRYLTLAQGGWASAEAVAALPRALGVDSGRRQTVKVSTTLGRGVGVMDGGQGQATASATFDKALDIASVGLASAMQEITASRLAAMISVGNAQSGAAVALARDLATHVDSRVVFLANLAISRAMVLANVAAASAAAGIDLNRGSAVSASATAISRAAVLAAILRGIVLESGGTATVEVSLSLDTDLGVGLGAGATAGGVLGLARGLGISQEAAASVYGIIAYALARGAALSGSVVMSAGLALALQKALSPTAEAISFATWYEDVLRGIDASGAAIASGDLNLMVALALAIATGGGVGVNIALGKSMTTSIDARATGLVSLSLPVSIGSLLAGQAAASALMDVGMVRILSTIAQAAAMSGLSLRVNRATQISASELQLWIASLLRTYTVPRESRVHWVGAERRLFGVPAENRVHPVGTEPRTYSVLPEARVYQVPN